MCSTFSPSCQVQGLVDHLFRHQAGRLVSILTRIFGSEHLEMAEDVVQDALVEAIKNWQYSGIPENPSAWLFQVAKNKALNIVNHQKLKYSSDVVHFLQSRWTAQPALDQFFSEDEIQDDQLRMIFTCCHPSISADSQIALALKTLCGFSIPEIARAFFTTPDTINKRLVRARKIIRKNRIGFVVPSGDELSKRLETVLEMIYLLYNEGYSASTGEEVIRFEICEEAIRLAEMVVAHRGISDKFNLYALLSLMQLNASRFKARVDREGNILTLEQQDRSSWDKKLIQHGIQNLEKSVSGDLSKYHILAGISAYHCLAINFEHTHWKSILDLYDKLMQIDSSPVVLLNRAIVLSKIEGAEAGILQLNKIKDMASIKSYHLFHSTAAELLLQNGQFSEAEKSLQEAINLAPLESEKRFLKEKLMFCKIHPQ